MGTPYLSELRITSFGFAPKGWAAANGQLLPINQNQALFSLLGTTYGGNGTTNFALPNLQGRVPMHVGGGHVLGEIGGEQGHTLTLSEMASHSHTMNASTALATMAPAGRTPGPSVVPAQAVTGTTASPIPVDIYSSNAAPDIAFAASTIGNNGGGAAHLNVQPFLTLDICIALQGVFP
jgi:microcystin-dependent protein